MRITKKLIDRLALLDEQISFLKEEAEVIRTEIKAKGDGVYTGNLFEVEVVTTETTTLDQRAVKALLEPAQIIACSKSGTRTNIRIKTRQPVAA